jgi:putative ABC transport system permease protein
MKQSLYLAIKYLLYYRSRTLILVCSIGLLLYLPLGLQKLISESELTMMARADASPLIVGAKGNATDLVINTLYFEQTKIDELKYSECIELDNTGFGYSIPIISLFNAREIPIIGTNLDYFLYRDLRIEHGRNLSYVGECIIGSKVADNLDLSVGDSLISSPENFLDLAGVYPLQMTVVGILEKANTPDDKAIFTDLKTNWIIMGLGHGHQDMQKVTDPSLILSKDSTNVTASPKLFIYNKVDGKDHNSFHFHGNIADYPISSVLFIPENHKSATLLRGRFETGEYGNQIIIPTEVVDNLLQNIFRIKQAFSTVFILVGIATLFILGLIVTLSLRLRKDEINTMFVIGSSKNKIVRIVGAELLISILLSLVFAMFLYSITGLFVEDFIQQFII